MKQIEIKQKTPQKSTVANCIPQETVIKDVRLAAAYVPYQILCTLFTPVDALMKGTAFPELFSPYKGENKKVSPCQLEAIKKERI